MLPVRLQLPHPNLTYSGAIWRLPTGPILVKLRSLSMSSSVLTGNVHGKEDKDATVPN